MITAPAKAPAEVPRGLSCEAALALSTDRMDLTGGSRVAPDLPREAFGRVLDNGAYFSHCGAPATMGIDICAAIQEGHVVGLTVVTEPASEPVRACIASAVHRLAFPRHPRLDVARTRFEPSR